MNKSISEVVHQGAEGLHSAGLIDDITLKEFDALCLPPVKDLTPKQIQTIRKNNKASQAVFAVYLNISKSTVQKWEQGLKKPNGSSLKLLNIVEQKGLEVLV